MIMNESANFAQQAQELMRTRRYSTVDVEAMKLMANDIIRISSDDAKTRAGLLGGLLDLGLPVGTFLPWINNTSVSMAMLCVSVKGGFPEGLDMLLQRGADIMTGRGRYYTILESAIGKRDVECVRVILQRRSIAELMDAEVFSRDGSRTPRTLWQTFSSQPRGVAGDENKIVELLLEAGMPVDGLFARACGQTTGDFAEAVDLLVRHGCDINDPDNPPLLIAAGANKPKMVQRLLDLGADPAIRSVKGATAMRCGGRHPEVKEVLYAWKTDRAVVAAVGGEGGSGVVQSKRSVGMSPL